MHPKLRSAPGIYLVGFMGSGKSTVGRQLAERLGWRFVDLDAEIELEAGKPIARIFEEQGEPAFREVERLALERLVSEVRSGAPTVASLGGGAFASQANRELLADAGLTIWLDAPVETLWERVRGATDRPLARDRKRFAALLAGRRSAYASADFRFDADRPLDEVVAEILRAKLA